MTRSSATTSEAARGRFRRWLDLRLRTASSEWLQRDWAKAERIASRPLGK